MDFTFNDYLDFLINHTIPEKRDKINREVATLRNHTASFSTMQKHWKQYKTLLDMSISGIMIDF